MVMTHPASLPVMQLAILNLKTYTHLPAFFCLTLLTVEYRSTRIKKKRLKFGNSRFNNTNQKFLIHSIRSSRHPLQKHSRNKQANLITSSAFIFISHGINKSYTAQSNFKCECTINFTRHVTRLPRHLFTKKLKKITRHEPTCSGIIHINYCQPTNFSQLPISRFHNAVNNDVTLTTYLQHNPNVWEAFYCNDNTIKYTQRTPYNTVICQSYLSSQ
jgi:hypothetical protein